MARIMITKMTSHKAWIAGIGAILTALTTAFATVQVVLDDGSIDIGEYGALATAAATLIATIYGVWRVPNQVTNRTLSESDKSPVT